MDVAVDVYVAVPLLFTVLAVIIASLYLRFRPSDASVKDQATSSKVDESKAEEEPRRNAEEAKTPDDVSEEQPEKSADESEKTKGKMPVEEIGAGEGNLQNQETTKNSEKEPVPTEEKSPQTNESKQEPSHPEEKLKKEEDEAEIGSTKSLPDEGTDDLVDEYRPGKIRGSNYEKTLTREELEAEQRAEE
ncbi:matrix-remodeling-associated protein 7-like isoform X2 [Carcharodon carcharias]|uniref:matrix-remodeling-associated protein 7-like isoform X2 n=1 Tax=Carcharodon carcharias TaxID=13397 RepID=UPI001B7E1C8F|nr:matrix-remodeling-associated protein 7-like isoform X2 [Carcharodon carcharias]